MFVATPNKIWLTTYQWMDRGKVLLGNNSKNDIVGVGDVRIHMHDRIMRTLIGVRHVPELEKTRFP